MENGIETSGPAVAAAQKRSFLGIALGILLLVVVVVIISLFLIKVVWAWTVPDIFPGAVREGLVAGSISWLTSFKLALFLGVTVGGVRHDYYTRRPR